MTATRDDELPVGALHPAIGAHEWVPDQDGEAQVLDLQTGRPVTAERIAATAALYAPERIRPRWEGSSSAASGDAEWWSSSRVGDPAVARDLAIARGNCEHTDVGNARRFVIDHGDVYRHARGVGDLVWDGTRFRVDDVGHAVELAKASARKTRQVAARYAQDTADAEVEAKQTKTAAAGEALERAKAAEKAAVSWGTKSQSGTSIAACLTLVRSEPAVAVRSSDLDAHAHLLNTPGGTVDLHAGTGAPQPHDPAALLTRSTRVTPDYDMATPLWDDLLARITGGDLAYREWLHRWLGYLAFGDTSEQAFFLLWGDGGTGKSTVVGAVEHALGDYAISSDSSSWTTKGRDRAARSDIARLRFARAILASELPKGAHLDEDLVKRWTGGDTITARFNRKDEFDFVPVGKLVLHANHLPSITDGGHSIWRRVRVLPMTQRIPRPQLGYGKRLQAEAPGILADIVRGGLDLRQQAEGLGTCDAVEDASAAYRQQADHVAAFLADATQPDAQGRVPARDLTHAYERWCDDHGVDAKPAALWTSLDALGYPSRKSNGTRHRHGLRLTTGAGS